jgi:hypothetical protein
MTTEASSWRKSSFTDNGQCVEIADLGDEIAVRNSNHPDRGALVLDGAATAAWVAACAAGEFDDHT